MAWPKRLKKEDLLRAVRQAGIGSEVEAAEVLDVCTKALVEMFGEETAKELQPLFFRNNTITIKASSSIIAQEVKLRELELFRRINKNIDSKKVEHLLWRL